MKNEILNGKIEIVSGEGDGEGTAQLHTGVPSVRAVRAAIKREQCNGDRWAYARVDGQRIEV